VQSKLKQEIEVVKLAIKFGRQEIYIYLLHSLRMKKASLVES